MNTKNHLPSRFLISALNWRGCNISKNLKQQLYNKSWPELDKSAFSEFLKSELGLIPSITETWFDQFLLEYNWLNENKAHICTIFDSDFPESLRCIENGPSLLTYWGDLNFSKGTTLSVVGSRHPTALSLSWMESELNSFIQSKKDLIIVSGGAKGIDQKAHFIALRNQSPTIVILPSGLGHVYPTEILKRKEQFIESGGGIASTLSPLARMQKRYFIERNRYIAAWSKATLVIEARRRSGSLITARWATLLDREILVLPCSPISQGLGGLDLLIDGGAIGVRDSLDLNQAYYRWLAQAPRGPNLCLS